MFYPLQDIMPAFPGFSFWKLQVNLSLLPSTYIPIYIVTLLVRALNKLTSRRHVNVCLLYIYICMHIYVYMVLILYNNKLEGMMSSKKNQ